MSEVQEQPALKGIAIGQRSENSGPLVIVEGKKDGRNTVMTQITLNNGEKVSDAVASGATYSGVFEGIKTKKGTDGYPDKNYVLIRGADSSLTQIAMGAGLTRNMEAAYAAGLLVGDALEISFNGTKKLENGRTFHAFSVNI